MGLLDRMGLPRGIAFEEVNRFLYEGGFTDGLPVVPPLPERVEAMLAANGFRAEVLLGSMPPMRNVVQVEDVAVCAVMAGCANNMLGPLVTTVEAMLDPRFNLLGIQTTTGNATPLIIFAGSVADRLGLNSGSNCLGPGVRANATLGRAVRLILQNIGGARPGVTDMATLGQPGKFTFCLAENLSKSPWAPLHTERGFQDQDSTVTVVAAAGIVEVVDSASTSAEAYLTTLAHSMVFAGALGDLGDPVLGSGEPVVVLTPECARLIARDGWGKRETRLFLFQQAFLRREDISPQVAEYIEQTRGELGLPPWTGRIPIARQPDDIIILVAGGAGIKSAFVPTWNGGGRSVTRRIPNGGWADPMTPAAGCVLPTTM